MKLFILFLMTLASFNAFSVNSSRLLLSAFCPDVGSQSTQALNQSQQLNDILEQLQNDNNCSTIASSTSNLLLNVRALESLERAEDDLLQANRSLDLYEEEISIERANLFANFETQTRAEITRDNPSLNELDVNSLVEDRLVSYQPESDLLTTLEGRVNEFRLDRLDSQLRVGFDLREDTRRRAQIGLIQANISSVLSALNTSHACTNANESIAPYITSNILGLAATVVHGVAGAAVTLSSDLVNGTAALLRGIKYTKLNRKIERNEMKIALSCSFEGLSNTYCRAKDTINLIDFNKSTSKDECETENCKLLSQGISLVSKKSNSLNSWVNFILSGASPRDASQVSSYQNAINLRSNFNVLSQTLEGLLNGARTELSRPGANETTVLRDLMENLATLVAANSFGSPFSSSSDDTFPYADFFQVGNDRECGAWAYFFNPEAGDRTLQDRPDQQSCRRFATELFSESISIAELQERVRVLNEETSVTVAFEVQLVSEENTSSILARYESIDNEFKTSPKVFIKGLLDYYSKFRKYLEKNDMDRPLLSNLITRAENQVLTAEQIIFLTNCDDFEELKKGSFSNILASESCDLESNKIANLSLILAPNQQVLSVQNSLRAIFREHVEIAKTNGDISNDRLLDILNTDNEDSSNILVRNDLDIQGLFEDSTNAMEVSKGNLNNFWDTFSRSILKTAKELKKEGSNIVLGRLCVRAALAPLSKSRASKLSKYCRGTVYKSSNRRVGDIKFDDIILKKFESKACDVYDFQRKLRYLNNL